ncbi:type II toxin-antitoxin system HicB family antitoxin [Candidatus Poriferisodalis sp.]|uniref:type II toxin-antitoxin system HicB family antitoxin n=1 Tax=Candidatus Poriferisodalis sp. TaxID=3101277 RepID=UPI003B515C4D
MKLTYAVVIEQTPKNYGAYAPDVPGCISTAATPDEMLANIREAIAMMLDVDPADVGAIDVHVQEQGEAGSLA